MAGANAGIGKETANDLYKRGATVVMLCRSEERANAAMKWIRDNNAEVEGGGSNGTLRFESCDMSSMKGTPINDVRTEVGMLVKTRRIVWEVAWILYCK